MQAQHNVTKWNVGGNDPELCKRLGIEPIRIPETFTVLPNNVEVFPLYEQGWNEDGKFDYVSGYAVEVITQIPGGYQVYRHNAVYEVNAELGQYAEDCREAAIALANAIEAKGVCRSRFFTFVTQRGDNDLETEWNEYAHRERMEG